MYYAIKEVFTYGKNMSILSELYDQEEGLFTDVSALGLFVDNHDVKRFLNENDNVVLLKNALTFILTSPGIPIVYYGTE